MSFGLNMRMGIGGYRMGGSGLSFLQDIVFNPTTSLYEDAKGNMTPSLVDVPCAVFNGTSDYIQTSVNYAGANYAKFGGWFYKAASGDIVTTGCVSAVGDLNRLDLSWYSDGNMYFINSNGANSLGSVPLSGIGWHYIEVEFDGTLTGNSNRLKGYVDGVQQTLTFIGTIPETISNIAESLKIGKGYIGYSKGRIASFYAKNRAGDYLVNTSLQEFSGTKVFNKDGSIAGTWSGSGARYARVSGIPSPHQAADIKRVTHAGGTAYVPATVSDATINANFTTVTNIETLSGLYKDDGSRMNLHPTTNNNPAGNGQTISEYFASLETSSGIDLNTYEAGQLLPTAYNYAIKDKPAGITQDLAGVFNGSAKLAIGYAQTIVGDFEIEFKFKTNSLAANTMIYSNGGYAAGQFYIDTWTGRKARLILNTIEVRSLAINEGQWYSGKCGRRNNVLYMQLYGQEEQTVTNALVLNNITYTGMRYIGTSSSGSSGYFNGLLAEININNQAIYPLNGNAIDTITGLPATNTGVTFASTNETTSLIKLKKP